MGAERLSRLSLLNRSAVFLPGVSATPWGVSCLERLVCASADCSPSSSSIERFRLLVDCLLGATVGGGVASRWCTVFLFFNPSLERLALPTPPNALMLCWVWSSVVVACFLLPRAARMCDYRSGVRIGGDDAMGNDEDNLSQEKYRLFGWCCARK
jgi:hypothetical protein